VPPKYPSKKYYKGPKKGQLSCNPLGKNPDDVWSMPADLGDFWGIPNVKHNHAEKTEHPCQFPIGLAQRFIAALTDRGDAIFDPFLGVGTTSAAAALLGRRFFGCEVNPDYFSIARDRVEKAIAGVLPFRDANKPIYEPPAVKQTFKPRIKAA
jgi:adenine-specific DNA-methyltransferase